MPLIVLNYDGFLYSVCGEYALEKARLCEFMYMCVYLLQPLIRSSKQREITNKPHHFTCTPQDFLLCFFSPLITVMLLPTLAAENTARNTVGKRTGKTFAGSGVMAARQVPPRTGKVLSRPGGQNTGFGESPLFPAATGSSKYVILYFFILCGP